MGNELRFDTAGPLTIRLYAPHGGLAAEALGTALRLPRDVRAGVYVVRAEQRHGQGFHARVLLK
jgi:hypothetical protein